MDNLKLLVRRTESFISESDKLYYKDVIKLASDYYKIPIKSIMGKDRRGSNVRMIVWRILNINGYTQNEISKIFDRTNRSIISSAKKVLLPSKIKKYYDFLLLFDKTNDKLKEVLILNQKIIEMKEKIIDFKKKISDLDKENKENKDFIDEFKQEILRFHIIDPSQYNETYLIKKWTNKFFPELAFLDNFKKREKINKILTNKK